MNTLHPYIRVVAVRIKCENSEEYCTKSHVKLLVIVITDIIIYQSSKVLTNKANNEKAHVSQRKSR